MVGVKQGRYRAFLRNTSNVSAANRYMVSLPKEIWEQMEWEINDNLIIDTIKMGIDNVLCIKKESK